MSYQNDISIIKSGVWETKGGSRLILKINENGLVSGSYATSHGRPGQDDFFPVTGWVNHNLLSLCCAWGEHRSMTTWCGRFYHEDGKDVIKYMWHLAREFEDKEHTVENNLTFTFHTMSGTFIRKEEK